MQGPFLRKYGAQTTIPFVLYSTDGVNLKTDAAHASGDTTISKDEGNHANTTNGFVDEGTTYSITLTATEMQAARIALVVADQGTKAWLDTAMVIDTYGNASAQHAVDLSDSVRAGLTALPNAAADAAGGLIISDAGGFGVDNLKYFGALWFDSENGAGGTTVGVNGTYDNPVNSIANLITLVGTTKIKNINVAAGSTFTIPDALPAGLSFTGDGWELDLNSEDISGLSVAGALVDGVGTASGDPPRFFNCSFATTTLPPGTITEDCGIGNAVTLATGNYDFPGLRTEAGATASLAASSTDIIVRLPDFNGDLSLSGFGAGSIVTVDGAGILTIGSSQSGLTVRHGDGVDVNNNGSATTVPFGIVVSAASIADAVWEEDLSDHSGTSGSAAEALNAAGAGGDPWLTELPGAYEEGTAGHTIGTALPSGIDDNQTAIQAAREDISGIRFRKNIAFTNFKFKMTATDGTPATGLTITAERAIDDGSFSACANSVTEISGGWYRIDLATTDLNGDSIAFKFTATGAKQLDLMIVTQDP